MKILFSGEGGQGIQLMAKIFANVCYKSDYNVVFMPHYGVEMRMGISMVYLQIEDSKTINYPKFSRADIVVALTPRDLYLTKSFVGWGTRIINAMNLMQVMKENDIPKKSLNMLALGILCREFKKRLPLDTGKIKDEIKSMLAGKSGLEKNLDAFMQGINLPEKYYYKSLENYPHIDLSVTKTRSKEKEYYHSPAHCKGCGLCIEKCPKKALSWSEKRINYFGAKVPEVDIEKCNACLFCEKICPDMAIKVIKKK